MLRRTALLAAIGVLAPAAAAHAAPVKLLDTTLLADAAKARTCAAAPLDRAAGVARTALTAVTDGYLSVRLDAAGGDWDVAAFAGDRLVAGAAGFGARELAQGFVRRGQRIAVQACRRSGDARSARVTATLAPVDLSAKHGPVKLVEIETPRREDVERLTTLGLDLTEHGEEGHREAVLYTAAEERLLRARGFRFRTKIADLAEASRRDRAADRRYAASVAGSPLPSGRETYRRLADYDAEMKALAEAHPDLVKGITLDLPSLEGRAVHGIEITPDVHAQDGKPVFFMSGVHHAREWPSAENPFEFAVELVKGYGTDPRVTRLLDRARVIVVPVMNPDGFNLSREAPNEGTLYEYKRKNCRTYDGHQVPGVCALAPEASGTGVGVDPNRNWGGDWGGPGAANDTASATYRGAAPFSEPEVENLRRLIASRQVTTFITNHTHGSLILRPPGIAAFGLSKDEALLKDLGDTMADHNHYTSQYSWQLYDTSGTAEAWSYYATGGLGYTFEIHRGNFHQAYQQAVVGEYLGETSRGGPTGNRGAYFTALESTVDTARHGVITGEAPAGTKLTLTKSFDNPTSRIQPPAAILPWGDPIVLRDTLTSSLTVPADGRFEWHVNPSTRPDVYGGRPATGPTTPDFTVAPAATTRREFTVAPGEDNAGLRVRLDAGTPAEDWTLELFKEVDGEWVRQARSAVGNRSYEDIETHLVGPGNYELRMTAVRAQTPAKVTADFLEPEPAETWTLGCEGRDGTREVVVDRGQTVNVGRLCEG
jgi:hypothetical protein